ncbi:MAG TPA: hypothetical protein VNM37_20260, partial [Candidatus Dormibacteraeota bacterium]|nr:hypothetical protein [Candidatus Dormibacteraeota bacterium]
MKGLEVVSCSWKNPEAAAAQVRDTLPLANGPSSSIARSCSLRPWNWFDQDRFVRQVTVSHGHRLE